MPSCASNTAVVGVSLMSSICVTGFCIPIFILSIYMGLNRFTPWLSMPRLSLSISTSAQSFASSSGTPTALNASVIKLPISFHDTYGLVSIKIASCLLFYDYTLQIYCLSKAPHRVPGTFFVTLGQKAKSISLYFSRDYFTSIKKNDKLILSKR